jgi:hypothetical protein
MAARFQAFEARQPCRPGTDTTWPRQCHRFPGDEEGRIYAGANSKQVESVWRAEGWDQKLKASIEAAGPSFSGPLINPDEPWHYDYAPSQAAKKRN